MRLHFYGLIVVKSNILYAQFIIDLLLIANTILPEICREAKFLIE